MIIIHYINSFTNKLLVSWKRGIELEFLEYFELKGNVLWRRRHYNFLEYIILLLLVSYITYLIRRKHMGKATTLPTTCSSNKILANPLWFILLKNILFVFLIGLKTYKCIIIMDFTYNLLYFTSQNFRSTFNKKLCSYLEWLKFLSFVKLDLKQYMNGLRLALSAQKKQPRIEK